MSGDDDVRYLVRLDDACDTMPRRIWERVEAALADLDVSPLVAVIPDNRDEKMLVDEPDPGFWHRVRGWQDRGWAIGVHGLHHVLVQRRGTRTEFANLPGPRQEEMLDAALAIFAREGVRPDAWVAPNHTFDRTTVRALKSRGLDVISDGYAVLPYRDADGVLRVPQQLWRFEERPPGVWTICKHPNGWDQEAVSRFEHEVRRFSDRVTDFRSVIERFSSRRRDTKDLIFSARRWAKGTALRGVRSARGRPAAD